MNHTAYLWTDGSKKRIAWVIKTDQVEEPQQEIYTLPQEATTNEAEYLALIRGLAECHKRGHKGVSALSDSELMEVYKELKLFSWWSIRWVPREDNLAGVLLDKNK